MGMLAAASLHLVSLEAPETTSLGNLLPKKNDFRLLSGDAGGLSLSPCAGEGYSASCSRLWTPVGEVEYPLVGGPFCS